MRSISDVLRTRLGRSGTAGTQTGFPCFVLRGAYPHHSGVAFDPTGRFLSGGSKVTAQIWDVETKQFLRVLDGEGRPDGYDPGVKKVAFSRRGTIAGITTKGNVVLWVAATGRRLLDAGNTCIDVSFDPTGFVLALVGTDGIVRLWRPTSSKEFRVLSSVAEIQTAAFHPSGEFLATGGQDGTISIVHVDTGDCVKVLKDHASNILSLSFNGTGDLLASGTAALSAQVWRPLQGVIVATHYHQSAVGSVRFHRSLSMFATRSREKIDLLSTNTWEIIKTIPRKTNSKNIEIDFHPTFPLLAASSATTSVGTQLEVYDLSSLLDLHSVTKMDEISEVVEPPKRTRITKSPRKLQTSSTKQVPVARVKSSRTSRKPETLYCSFCGKSNLDVSKLIAGPTVFICDECVELCMKIIKPEKDQLEKTASTYSKVDIEIAITSLTEKLAASEANFIASGEYISMLQEQQKHLELDREAVVAQIKEQQGATAELTMDRDKWKNLALQKQSQLEKISRSDDKFRRAKNVIAKGLHPNKLTGAGEIDKRAREVIFKEIWPEIEQIEKE